MKKAAAQAERAARRARLSPLQDRGDLDTKRRSMGLRALATVHLARPQKPTEKTDETKDKDNDNG